MDCIIISYERIFEGEATILNRMFEAGMSEFHLRKPQTPHEEVQALVGAIDPQWRPRIVLHDHFDLYREFDLKGIHLNRRNPTGPPRVPVVSRSCHTLTEVRVFRMSSSARLLLSPIFDSITKGAYTHAFSDDELREAREKRIINQQVIALGGITPNKIPMAAWFGFGGVAPYGYLWGVNSPQAADEALYIERFLELKQAADSV